VWVVDGTHWPRPVADTPTHVAISQIAHVRAGQAPEAPRPVVALASAHEVGQLAQAHLAADLVVRLAKNRVFRRAPQPYTGRGRPHKHGPVLKLQDASTHGPADRSASLEHPVYGTVTVDAWTSLHVEDASAAPFAVLRVQVEHLPQLDVPRSALAGMDRQRVARGSAPDLALVPAALHRGTCLPLCETALELDHAPRASAARRRPLDLAGGCSVLAALAGQTQHH
jgi:hypothetical protein